MDFIDLKAQQTRLKEDIDQRMAAVLAHGRYIMGPEVSEFEEKLAKFGAAKHALSCANGTDALALCLRAWEIGPGDAVFCPSFTFCATAEVVALVGATPVFIDIDRETYNMSPESLAKAISEIKAQGELNPRAVIGVCLFGQAANYPAISKIAIENGLKLIADSAQGFGTTINGDQPLKFVDATTTSFFPAKPLGCYGDGGAILTDDDDLAENIRSVRNHGAGKDRYDNVRIGVNSRLDSLQAAVLLSKLSVFSDEIIWRNAAADYYTEQLSGLASRVPVIKDGITSTWAQYTIEVEDPDVLQAALKEQGIPSARYYPKPIHLQSAYKHYPMQGNGLTNTEAAMTRVISLPMYADLTRDVQDKVIGGIKIALNRS